MRSSLNNFLLLLCARIITVSSHYDPTDDIYPDTVVPYHVRKDHYSNEPVSRGRLELLGGLFN